MKAILEMDMPTDCCECILSIKKTYYGEFDKTWVCAGMETVRIVKDEIKNGIRHKDCPLKEVAE